MKTDSKYWCECSKGIESLFIKEGAELLPSIKAKSYIDGGFDAIDEYHFEHIGTHQKYKITVSYPLLNKKIFNDVSAYINNIFRKITDDYLQDNKFYGKEICKDISPILSLDDMIRKYSIYEYEEGIINELHNAYNILHLCGIVDSNIKYALDIFEEYSPYLDRLELKKNNGDMPYVCECSDGVISIFDRMSGEESNVSELCRHQHEIKHCIENRRSICEFNDISCFYKVTEKCESEINELISRKRILPKEDELKVSAEEYRAMKMIDTIIDLCCNLKVFDYQKSIIDEFDKSYGIVKNINSIDMSLYQYILINYENNRKFIRELTIKQ